MCSALLLVSGVFVPQVGECVFSIVASVWCVCASGGCVCIQHCC